MLTTPLLLAMLAQTAAPAPATATTPAEMITPAGPAPDRGWLPLFNGENFNGWYTFNQRDGKNNDGQHVFKVEHGAIHVLDVDPAISQPNGYLATNEDFRNYRLRVEYKWGEKKLPVPRHPEGLPRDAGILYHMTGPDGVWPLSVECQIQERDTGDIWLLPNNPPNPSANVTVASADGPVDGGLTYKEGGVPAVSRGQRISHSAPYDTPEGWNTVEVLASENNAVHVVNGHVNNAVSNLQLPNHAGPMNHGRILLQEENNEVYYRRVEIKPLFADNYRGPAYKILVLTMAGSDQPGVAALQSLGKANNFTADATSDPAAFTEENLKPYKAVVFWGITGSAFNEAQKKALQNYVHQGGGFAGVNAAMAASDWDWYDQLVGANVDNTTDGISTEGIKLEDPHHPSTSSLPITWTHQEYVPYFNMIPEAKLHLLATVLDASNANGGPGANPVAWCHDYDGGRGFYTALGSAKDDLSNPLFLMHLLGGIMYAAKADGSAP